MSSTRTVFRRLHTQPGIITDTIIAPDPPSATPTWQTHRAIHQRPLDEALIELRRQHQPHELIVVVRTAGQRIRYGRMLEFPNQVYTLADFLGLAGPEDIRDEDLVPPLVVEDIIQRSLPDAYHAEGQHTHRTHLSAQVAAAIHLLETQGLTIDESALDRAHGDVLVAIHRASGALTDRRASLHRQGLWTPGERVTIAAGPSRLHERFPGCTSIAFIGFDTLSPSERRAACAVTKPADSVHFFVVGNAARIEHDGTPKNTTTDTAPTVTRADRASREGREAGADDRTRITPDSLGNAPTDQVIPYHAALALNQRLIDWLAEEGTVRSLHASPTPTDHTLPDHVTSRHARLHWLFSDRPHEQQTLPGLALRTPHDRRSEVDETAHWAAHLLAHDPELRPHDIAIIAPDLATYAPLLAEALREHGLPYASSHPGHTRHTPSGDLLLLLLDLLDHDLPRDDVLDLIEHPIVSWSNDPSPTPEPEAPARLRVPWLRARLREHGLRPRGQTAWHNALDKAPKAPGLHFEEAPKEPAPHRNETHTITTVRTIVDELADMATIDEASIFIDRLRSFLDVAGIGRGVASAMRRAHDSARLRAGHLRILRILDETEDALHIDGNHTIGVRHVRDHLRERAFRDTVPADVDPQHGIQVTSLRNVRGARFKHAWVLGCTHHALPGTDDAGSLVDLLETATGTSLERVEREPEAHRTIHGVLADTSGDVVLSHPGHDEDAEVPASVLINEIVDSFASDPQTLAKVDAACRAVQTRRRMLQLVGTERRRLIDAPAAMGTAHQLVAARAAGTHDDPFTGHIEAAMSSAVALRPQTPFREPDRRPSLSPSALESYAVCPFRYLIQRGLLIRTPKFRDDDVGALDRGSVIHRILEVFIQQLIDDQGGPMRIGDQADLERRIVAVVDRVWDDIPYAGPDWDALRGQLLAGLRPAGHPHASRPPGLLARFLENARTDGARVALTESAFGMDEGPDVHIDTPDGPVYVRGKIDRIDIVASAGVPAHDQGIRVIDYKSGNAPHRDLTLGGIQFQLPIYVIAARTILETSGTADDIGTFYSFKRAKEKKFGPAIPAPVGPANDDPEAGRRLVESALPRRISEMRRAAAAGHHAVTLLEARDAHCDHCDVRRICGLRTHLQRIRRRAALERRDKAPEDPAATGFVPDLVGKQVRGDPVLGRDAP